MSGMTIEQYNKLKVGDIITLNGSVNRMFVGKKCPVTFVEELTRVNQRENQVCIHVDTLGDRIPVHRRYVEPYVLSPDDNVDTDGSILL